MTKASLWAALALLCLALPAAAAPPPPDAGGDPADPLPRRRFQPLPGKVVGVLVSGGQDVLALEGRRGPADAYCLGSGEGSYRGLYVPVAKKWTIGGLNVPVGPKGDTVKAFRGLSVAGPQTAGAWGVRGPYTLVEVEVNGGLGAPPGETFVATGLRVVEGTKEYPLHVTPVIGQLRRRFQLHLKEQEDAISHGLSEARARLPEGHRLVPGREQTETAFVTWLPDTDQVRVVLRARVAQKALRTAAVSPPPRPAQAGADGRPPSPPVPAGVEFGVEVGMTYDVSAWGLIDRSRPGALRPYQKQIPAQPK